MDMRIKHYYKVTDKSHETRAMYLSGLLSTLGSLSGGTSGAIAGGIAGRAISHLALEYDRLIPSGMSFVANALVSDIRKK